MDVGRRKVPRFAAYFQPIVHLDTGAIEGFEALARIISPDGSVREPGTVIEDVEKDINLFNDLMWTILSSINRTMFPLFKKFRGFYISFNMPPAARALRIRTIAEGVETWEQSFFLRAAGVDCGQGWYRSKALPPEDVEGVLQKGFGPGPGGD